MPSSFHAALLMLGAYLLGSIPFGLLAGRLRGVDIREVGSKNIGATNVWRTFGWKLGLPTFLCDLGKGLVGVWLAQWLGGKWGADPSTAGILAAVGCILGHTFPIWLRFRGGKGVATSLGVLIGVVPIPALLTFLVWFTVFKLTRYVSLASILGALSLPVWVFVTMWLSSTRQGWSAFYFTVAATLLVIFRHSGNIKRLVAGTENRFGPKASQDGAAEEDTNSHLPPDRPANPPSPPLS